MLNVTPQTVYKWAKHGQIPSYRIGRRLRFRRNDFEQMFQVASEQMDGQSMDGLKIKVPDATMGSDEESQEDLLQLQVTEMEMHVITFLRLWTAALKNGNGQH